MTQSKSHRISGGAWVKDRLQGATVLILPALTPFPFVARPLVSSSFTKGRANQTPTAET